VSIKGIKLRNFRGFREADIELKPLTVLLGPNSAGKSAFGHALAAMRHCQWRHGQSTNATLTPRDDIDSEDWPVDLGQMNDLRTNGVVDRVYVSLRTEDGPVEFGFGLEPPEGDKRDLILSYFSYPETEVSRPSPMARQGDLNDASDAQINLPVTTGSPEHLEIGRPPAFHRINERTWLDDKDKEVNVQLDGLIVETVGHKDGSDLTLRSVARKDIRLLFDNLAYLRATRKRPVRGYTNEILRPQAIGYSGECTAGVLNQRGGDEIAFAVPPEIPNTVDGAKAILDKSWELKRVTLQTAVGEWLQRLGLATSVESVPSLASKNLLEIRVTLENQKPRDWCEVGFGISQLMPVLIAGLTQLHGGLLVVDLPEAHLHPLPQSKLADFFCSLVLSGRSALVETHSEMFFHRLRLRAEMHSDLAELIQVYFIDPPTQGTCCEPRHVGLRSSEELHWPEGFLQEAWEMESWIEVVRQAKREA
jgi:predicted ATPase